MVSALTSRLALFRAVFILARPLGVTVGDVFNKPHVQGALAVSRPVVTTVRGVAILIFIIPQRGENRIGNPN